MQFVESYDWVPSLGVKYTVGVDGIGFPLVLLSTIVSILVIIYSWGETNRPNQYFGLLLLNEVGVLGVFSSLDFFLFYIFWEVVLIPMYFLIGSWGGPRKDYAAIKFFIYTHVASLVMLLSIFAMALVAGTTSLGDIADGIATGGWDLVAPTLLLAAAAFFIATLAENARVPFDNPATHLELTMIHEAMLLEYSGKQLALMEISSMTKLIIFLAILSNVFFPWGIATDLTVLSLAGGLLAFLMKVLVLAVVIAIIESATAKMRLFRLPNILTVAFILSLLAVMSFYILGAT